MLSQQVFSCSVYLSTYLYLPVYLSTYLPTYPAPPSRGAAPADKICSDFSTFSRTRSVDCGGSSFFPFLFSFFLSPIDRQNAGGGGIAAVTTSIPFFFFFCWGGFRALVVVVCPFFRSLTPPAARKYVCGSIYSPPRGVKELKGRKTYDIYQHSLGLPCSLSCSI